MGSTTVTRDGSGDITAVTPATAPGGVTIPVITATGFIEVAASTTAGTYVVYGENGSGNLQFAEYFYVTVSPDDAIVAGGNGNDDGGNDELDAAVAAGITTWGNTADFNYIITTAVTDMTSVFLSSAFNGDISNWDVSAVTNMNQMFKTTNAFDGNISGWADFPPCLPFFDKTAGRQRRLLGWSALRLLLAMRPGWSALHVGSPMRLDQANISK